MKKTLITLIIAFLLGSYFAFILFKNLNNNIETVILGYEEVSVFQAGVFSTYENAKTYAHSLKSATVIEEDGFYRVYISVLNNDESINIMKEHFNSEQIPYHIRKINIKNSKLINELNKYQEILLEATEETTYDAINKKILAIYENEV